MTGLPPKPEEVEAFLKDESADAYAKLVDRLLDAPAYGEMQARSWLDVARYAEDQAHTFAVKPYSEAWRYRDWVIRAFNEDLPFEEFVKYQIAADLILGDSPDELRHRAALGFFGLGAQYYKNSDKAKAEADELDDRVDTLTRGFLGLTVAAPAATTTSSTRSRSRTTTRWPGCSGAPSWPTCRSPRRPRSSASPRPSRGWPTPPRP